MDAAPEKVVAEALAELRALHKHISSKKDLLRHAETLVQRHPWLHVHQALRYILLLGREEAEELFSTRAKDIMRTIRVNTLITSSDHVARRLSAKGFRVKKHPFIDYGLVVEYAPFSPGAAQEYLQGLYTIQGPASMMAVPAMEPANGDRIADACSGAGVKTTQIAQHAPESSILAFDANRRKLAALKNNASRLAVDNIIAYHEDARNLSHYGPFDKILLDAPCSGEGLIPFPRGRWPRSFNDIVDRARLQLELALAAARALRSGGTLLYSTCTMSVEENEFIAAKLIEHAGLEPHPPHLPGSSPGVEEYANLDLRRAVKACRRYYPHRHGTEGFTICRLRKP